LHNLGFAGFFSVQKYILFLVGSEDLNKKIPLGKKGLSTFPKFKTLEKFSSYSLTKLNSSKALLTVLIFSKESNRRSPFRISFSFKNKKPLKPKTE